MPDWLTAGIREGMRAGVREGMGVGVREGMRAGVREGMRAGEWESLTSGIKESMRASVYANLRHSTSLPVRVPQPFSLRNQHAPITYTHPPPHLPHQHPGSLLRKAPEPHLGTGLHHAPALTKLHHQHEVGAAGVVDHLQERGTRMKSPHP
jgi:hypothetical protein